MCSPVLKFFMCCFGCSSFLAQIDVIRVPVKKGQIEGEWKKNRKKKKKFVGIGT